MVRITKYPGGTFLGSVDHLRVLPPICPGGEARASGEIPPLTMSLRLTWTQQG